MSMTIPLAARADLSPEEAPAAVGAMIAAVSVRLKQDLDTGHMPFVTNSDGAAAAIEAASR